MFGGVSAGDDGAGRSATGTASSSAVQWSKGCCRGFQWQAIRCGSSRRKRAATDAATSSPADGAVVRGAGWIGGRCGRSSGGFQRFELLLQSPIFRFQHVDVVFELAVFGVDRFNVGVDVGPRAAAAAGDQRKEKAATRTGRRIPSLAFGAGVWISDTEFAIPGLPAFITRSRHDRAYSAARCRDFRRKLKGQRRSLSVLANQPTPPRSLK